MKDLTQLCAISGKEDEVRNYLKNAYTKLGLEVKYDEFLPDIVLKMVQGISQKTGAYSKFAQCRLKHW